MAETERYLKSTINIDGTTVPIQIVRFDFEAREAFTRDYRKMQAILTRRHALERLALMKADLPTQPDPLEPLEVAPKENEAPEVKASRAERNAAREARNAERLRIHGENLALAEAMRDLEETPEKRAQREQLENEDNEAGVRITKAGFRYVAVDPTFELIDSDDRPVRTGLDLLRSFPSQALYASVMAEVLVRNALASTLKKKSASPSASDPSLIAKSETSPAASGAPPAPTASSASTSDSAVPVAVTEAP